MRDLKVEQFLDDQNYEWEYFEDLPFGRITLDYNPARWQDKVDDDRVVSIGIDVERKMKMPAIVVAVTATEYYALLSGRHRIEGSKLAGATSMAAYLVTSVLDNFELEFLPYSLNNIEGRSPTLDTKLRHAAYFLKKAPERSRAAIVRKLGLKMTEVDAYMKMERAHDRAEALNVLTDLRKLPQEIRIAANEGLRLDAVFVGCVQCLAYVGWQPRQAKGFIKDLAACSSEEAALELIKTVAASHEELLKRLKRSNRRKRVLTPDQRWFYAARATAKVWPEHPDPKSFSAEDLIIARDTVMDLRAQCNEWIDKAMEAIATWERSKAARSTATATELHGDLSSEPG